MKTSSPASKPCYKSSRNPKVPKVPKVLKDPKVPKVPKKDKIMRHKQLFKTYVWLVETVYRFGPLTFDEIRDRWEYSSLYEGISMARTSFNRHRDEIEDIFGIRIVCDRSNSCRYSIADLRVPDRNSVLSWMANTLSLNNIIAENRAVHDRILLEPVPSEGETLRCAIEAMKTSRMIGIEYHKYQSEEILHYEVEPYCVKLYNRRWYVLVRFPLKDDFRILSFDRICRLEVSPKTFVMPEDFSASEFFKDFYGIYYDPAIPMEHVTIRAYGKERYYVRDLPIHPTQTIVGSGDDYTDYEIRLRPTTDFKAYLLSQGEWLHVLAPQALAEDIEARHRAAVHRRPD